MFLQPRLHVGVDLGFLVSVNKLLVNDTDEIIDTNLFVIVLFQEKCSTNALILIL